MINAESEAMRANLTLEGVAESSPVDTTAIVSSKADNHQVSLVRGQSPP